MQGIQLCGEGNSIRMHQEGDAGGELDELSMSKGGVGYEDRG